MYEKGAIDDRINFFITVVRLNQWNTVLVFWQIPLGNTVGVVITVASGQLGNAWKTLRRILRT